jgi:hypothetical protein
MRQFYDSRRRDDIVAPLVRQIPWSRHLQILGQCKLPEEREFYLRMAVQHALHRHASRRLMQNGERPRNQSRLICFLRENTPHLAAGVD